MTVIGRALVPAVLAGRTGAIPGIHRRAAQRIARAELSRPVYHQHGSWTERILRDVLGWLARLYHAANTVPGGWWGTVALAAFAVIVTAGILMRVGPVVRTGRGRRPLAPQGRPIRARDHREEAQRLAQAGDYAGAVCERLRAIAAELDERGVLPPRAGRTADEFAEEAGQVLPAHASAFREAARRFDEVCYGKRAGTRAGYDELRALDDRIEAHATLLRRVGAAPTVAGERIP